MSIQKQCKYFAFLHSWISGYEMFKMTKIKKKEAIINNYVYDTMCIYLVKKWNGNCIDSGYMIYPSFETF